VEQNWRRQGSAVKGMAVAGRMEELETIDGIFASHMML
jgi:hypothetical protein